jgi:glutathione peroxidase
MLTTIKILAPSIMLLLALSAYGDDLTVQPTKKAEMTTADFLNIPFNTITGEQTSLAQYKGKVILIVNVASKCGFTKQYAGLEKLYQKYGDKGLVIIGFPANNFANQEPGTNEQILEFCRSTYDVTFPMMAKISVKGDDIHPLYKYLTTQSGFNGDIRWNFTKFLLNKKGEPVARFDSAVEPLSDDIVGSIEKLL